MFEHAGELDDTAQLQLAPAAAGVRCAQGLGEIAGLLLEQAMGLRHELEVLRQRLMVALALGLDLLELGVDAGEGFVEWADEGLDRGLAQREGGIARALEGAEALAGEIQEALARAVEGQGRERFEAVVQAQLEARLDAGRDERAERGTEDEADQQDEGRLGARKKSGDERISGHAGTSR